METSPLYQLRPAEVFRALETSLNGLSTEEVVSRQELFGLNLLTEEKRLPAWRKFLEHSTHPMAILLWIAGGAALVLGEEALGIIIWILVLTNAFFSFARGYRAEQAMDALRKLLPEYTRVMRGGNETSIPASDLVPGDILVIAEGDHIPADARIIEEYGLRTNNSTLTGDAVPARKTADASLREGISEVERPNLVFAGTSVVSGTGKAIVYATGMLSQFGRIAHLTQVVEEGPSLLQIELINLTRKISYVAIGIGLAVGLLGIFEPRLRMHPLESVLLGLGVIAAALPEGLPATLTLSLAIAGQRLAQKGVLVKKLAVLETVGTISTICTDKSGTLTENQMTVREVWVARRMLNISGVGYEPVGSFNPNPSGQSFETDLKELLTAALLCNNSRLSPPAPGKPLWTSLGDQTEAAMRVAALKGGVDENLISHKLPRIHELPFDAHRKRMSTVHQLLDKQLPGIKFLHTHPTLFTQKVAYVKGAPREILQLCSHIQMDGELHLLDPEIRKEILEVIDDYAQRALRVLAIARRELPASADTYSTEYIEHDLTFLGLMAMHDPPRPEVYEAIQTCLQAGIHMVMITGDYGLTALSLARRVGMLTTPDTMIVTGAELDELNEIELQSLLTREVIFARMAPEHKLRLVAALQARGEVVAVTGDGVNDAPALRKADVGISMGISGTDVAKEAADIVLINDNFAAVVEAVREGRALYDNLRKSITYIFSSNLTEILPFIITALTEIPLSLRVYQILAIDLGTDLLPGLGLGSEAPEPEVMKKPPRRKDSPIVDRGLLHRAFLWLGVIETVLCYSGFFLVYLLAGKIEFIQIPVIHIPYQLGLTASLAHLSSPQIYRLAVTVFYGGVVMAQVGNAFACRTDTHRGQHLGWTHNRLLLFGIMASIALIILLIYFPPLANIFDHIPIPPALWIWLGLYAPILYTLDWIRKAIFRRHAQTKNDLKETTGEIIGSE